MVENLTLYIIDVYVKSRKYVGDSTVYKEDNTCDNTYCVRPSWRPSQLLKAQWLGQYNSAGACVNQCSCHGYDWSALRARSRCCFNAALPPPQTILCRHSTIAVAAYQHEIWLSFSVGNQWSWYYIRNDWQLTHTVSLGRERLYYYTTYIISLELSYTFFISSIASLSSSK